MLSLFSGICAGISCGCIVFFLGRVLSGVEFEKKEGSFANRRVPLVFMVAMPFLKIIQPLVRLFCTRVVISNQQIKLNMAGYSEMFTAEKFIGIRVFFLLVALGILSLGVLSGRLMIPFLMSILIAVYPGVWLSSTIKARHLSIMKALPNLLDVLTLSVESGRDLLSSMRDILARRKVDPLGEELMIAFREIQLGRKRSEALKAMADRVRQIDLTATVNAICQADELGVSIGQQLRIQSDAQRAKRFALAEKLANESSVKIIIPVVLFILPAVFIILLGPLILQTIEMFR